ncbi:hypothetical protein INR49_030233 [Caranx melampygus]|nr:hypothetical protein INR49_030233 [Caranx melampygus]
MEERGTVPQEECLVRSCSALRKILKDSCQVSQAEPVSPGGQQVLTLQDEDSQHNNMWAESTLQLNVFESLGLMTLWRSKSNSTSFIGGTRLTETLPTPVELWRK